MVTHSLLIDGASITGTTAKAQDSMAVLRATLMFQPRFIKAPENQPPKMLPTLEALYTTGSADLIHGAGSEMFEAMKILRAANPKQYAPQNGADYPRTQFGQRLMQIAAKCPVHRTLEGEVMFDERVELV